jgi:hypothetical protein
VTDALPQGNLRVLDCSSEIEGVEYLRSDYTVRCDDSEYLLVKSIAFASCFVYGVGIPAALGGWVRWKQSEVDKLTKQRKLNVIKHRKAYGFIYAGFSTDRYPWWETVVLYRKFAFVLIAVFVEDAHFQACVPTMRLM